MNLRIGVMHTLPAEEGTEGAQYAKDMNALIRKNMDLVKSEGTEIIFQFPRIGLDGFGAFQYAYMNTLNDMETLHGYMHMDQSGDYDAVIGWCFLRSRNTGRQASHEHPFGVSGRDLHETGYHDGCEVRGGNHQ